MAKTKSRKGSKKGPQKGLPHSKKEAPPKKGWEWAPFTKKSVAFTAAARKLSGLLTRTYGDNVTISQYEKMIASFQSMTKEQQSLIHIGQADLEALAEYRKARDIRDTERDTFRGNIAVADVEGGMEAIRAKARAISQPERSGEPPSYASVASRQPPEPDTRTLKEGDVSEQSGSGNVAQVTKRGIVWADECSTSSGDSKNPVGSDAQSEKQPASYPENCLKQAASQTALSQGSGTTPSPKRQKCQETKPEAEN